MGKQMKHLKELQVKAMAGDIMAQKALEAALYVPHHLRRARGGLRPRSGYSGHKDNAYVPVTYKQGVHVTAKTHGGIRCFDSITMDPSYGLDRLQMLKDRHA